MLLGIIGVFILISAFLIGYFLIYKKLMKGTKKLKISKILLWTIFIIYIIIVMGATLVDRVSGDVYKRQIYSCSYYSLEKMH